MTLCLSENRNMFLFGSISKFDFIVGLYIITAIIFALLFSRVYRFSDLTICVTLVRCKHLLVMNGAALSEFVPFFLCFLSLIGPIQKVLNVPN